VSCLELDGDGDAVCISKPYNCNLEMRRYTMPFVLAKLLGGYVIVTVTLQKNGKELYWSGVNTGDKCIYADG